MTKLLAALKYHAMIMAVIKFVEHTVPDDTPGLQKLDIALKAIIKMDEKAAALVPEITTLISGAKAVYNEAKALPNSDPAA